MANISENLKAVNKRFFHPFQASIPFLQPIALKEKLNFKICLNKNVRLVYTWWNVSAERVNGF